MDPKEKITMDPKEKASYGTLDGDRAKSLPHPTPHKKHHSIKGIVYVMLGSFSFSVMFLLVKLMATTNTFTLVFYRSLVQIAFSFVSLIWEGKSLLGPPETRVLLIMRAVFGSIAVCAWFFGIQELPLPDAVTLQFTTPAFAAIFAVCMVGEKWLMLDMIGAVVCLSGVILIAHPTWLFGKSEAVYDDAGPDMLMKALAVLITTGGAACAGIAYVSVRKIGERASANVMVLYYGVLSIPMTLLGSRLFLGTWNVWGGVHNFGLLFLMGVAGYGGQWFTNLGLQIETAATGTLVTTTQIVWTYIFELTILHGSLDPWSLGGTGLIMSYMLFVAALKMGKKAEHEHPTVAGEMEQAGMLVESVRSTDFNLHGKDDDTEVDV